MAAAMVSIPLSICALRGCKIPFPEFIRRRPLLVEFLEQDFRNKLSKSFSLFSSSSSPLLFVVVVAVI